MRKPPYHSQVDLNPAPYVSTILSNFELNVSKAEYNLALDQPFVRIPPGYGLVEKHRQKDSLLSPHLTTDNLTLSKKFDSQCDYDSPLHSLNNPKTVYPCQEIDCPQTSGLYRNSLGHSLQIQNYLVMKTLSPWILVDESFDCNNCGYVLIHHL